MKWLLAAAVIAIMLTIFLVLNTPPMPPDGPGGWVPAPTGSS